MINLEILKHNIVKTAFDKMKYTQNIYRVNNI